MPEQPEPVISFRGISKRYGRLRALNELSLDVRAGEVFGYIGLNGAGKTTSIRILLDLLRPDRGRVLVAGRDCRSQSLAVHSMIGYMPGEMGLYGDRTGWETLELLGRLSGRRPDPVSRDRLAERFELSPAHLKKRVREYSTGMKRKLGLIQAFQSDPPILILDEPTEGLDPLMQEAFYDLLRDVKQRGRTVFMSSHILSEVDRVCDRVGLLRKGELVLEAPVEEVRRMAPRNVRIVFDRDVAGETNHFPAELHCVQAGPREWRLTVNGPLGPILQGLAGLPVKDLVVPEPKLEDVLMQYYRDNET